MRSILFQNPLQTQAINVLSITLKHLGEVHITVLFLLYLLLCVFIALSMHTTDRANIGHSHKGKNNSKQVEETEVDDEEDDDDGQGYNNGK